MSNHTVIYLTLLLLICNTANGIKNTQAFSRGRGEISAEETFLTEKSAAEKKNAGLKAKSLLQDAEDHFNDSHAATRSPTAAPVTSENTRGIDLDAVHVLLDTAEQSITVNGSKTVKTYGIENIDSSTVTILLENANAKSDNVQLFNSSTFSKTTTVASAAPVTASPTKREISRAWRNSVDVVLSSRAPHGSVRVDKKRVAPPPKPYLAPSSSPSLPEITVETTKIPMTIKKVAKRAKQSPSPKIVIPTVSPSLTYAPSREPQPVRREAPPKTASVVSASAPVSPLTMIPTTLTLKTLKPVGLHKTTKTPVSLEHATLGPVSPPVPLAVVQEARYNSTEFQSGEIRSVHSLGVMLRMTGDFDIGVDGNAIFKAIEMELTDYLALTVPYLDTFELFLKFQSKVATTNETSMSGSNISNVVMASLSILMHLSSEQKGVLEDFTPLLATDLLRSAFTVKGIQDLLSAIVDYGVDMSLLELVHENPSSTEDALEKDVTTIPAADPQAKESIPRNNGLISAMLGGSFIFAIGAAAFTKARRTSHGVDDSQGNDDSEDLEVGNIQNKSSTLFPNLRPIECENGYVDRPQRLFQEGDEDSIDISLMDGPDLIASSAMDLSLQTKITDLKDSLREKLKWVSHHGATTSERGIGRTAGGETMFAVDLM